MSIDEMIEVLTAFKEGEEIEYFYANNKWVKVDGNLTQFDFSEGKYRIKSSPTREEITTQWVKDNNIVVGSKVKIGKKNTIGGLLWHPIMNETFGCIGTVQDISDITIGVRDLLGQYSFYFNIESLEPHKEEYVPFTWEDNELFADKLIKSGNNFYRIIGFNMLDITTQRSNYGYARALEVFTFADGTPFGTIKQ